MENSENLCASKKKVVLVVEDDDIIRKLLVMELKRKGHSVLEYLDAASAMNSIEREKPHIDVAVVDLMNIGYGGNMGDYLKRFPEYRSITVIYYTALTQQQFNTKILKNANTHYIQKTPGSIQMVVQKVEGNL